MDFPKARHYFYREINHPEEQINLAKAALYIAQEEYPDLEVDRYLQVLDRMALDVQERLPKQRYPLRIIQTINEYLYSQQGFQGNQTEYYDPRNSFLNQVIDRRTGIPITLSLVYLEIARRIDFPMVGIGMPGHFLIRPEFEEVGIFVDAFNQGEIMFQQDCQERLEQMYQQPVSEIPPAFLEPISHRAFLARMLTNLKMIYLHQSNLAKAVGVVERIVLLFPHAATELRDRGLLYYQQKRWVEAAQDLTTYLTNIPNAEDAAEIRQVLKYIEQNQDRA